MQHSFFNKLLATHAGYAALVLRVPVGLILMAHGAQKLFGWFGGNGLAGTAGEDTAHKIYSEQVLKTQISAWQFG